MAITGELESSLPIITVDGVDGHAPPVSVGCARNPRAAPFTCVFVLSNRLALCLLVDLRLQVVSSELTGMLSEQRLIQAVRLVLDVLVVLSLQSRLVPITTQ